jgi:hypothetical protein
MRWPGGIMMMHLRDFEGWTVKTRDNGDIGRVDDSYFDDERWVVRYFTMRANDWLGERLAPLSPRAIDGMDARNARICVTVTQQQLQQAPGFDVRFPATRYLEPSYASHLGFPYYWTGPGIWGPTVVPAQPPAALQAAPIGLENPGPDTVHLQSTRDVSGSHIHTPDGPIGHVENFIVDDRDWAIRYLIVDTSNWIGGRTVLVPPSWAREVDWANQMVHVDVSREALASSPSYDPTVGITPEFERRLQAHYGRMVQPLRAD